MKIVAWTLRIVLLLVLIWLVLLNSQTTTFSVMQGTQLELPLIVFLFIFFLLGVLFAWALFMPKYLGIKWSLRSARKQNEQNSVLIDEQQQLLAKYAPNELSRLQTPLTGTELPPYNM